jgi:ferric-dicitrate binding protein FerR (iron transport regulator)
MDKPDNIELLIVKYLNGTISDDEHRELKSWADMSDKNRLAFDRMREIWMASNMTEEKFRFDSQTAFDRFRKKVTPEKEIPRFRDRKKTKNIALSYQWVAAVLIFAVCGGMLLQYLTHTAGDENIPIAYQEITVPNGSRSKILLPDSSYITINAGTTLRYNTDFGKTQRDVWLDGEAYFVVKKSHSPFVVHSGTVQVKAVGTEFNMRAYSSENRIETTLVEGKVLVTDTNNASGVLEEVALLPNQKLIVSKKQISSEDKEKQIIETATTEKEEQTVKPEREIVKQGKIDPTPDISWKDDEWVIYRESLADLSVKLQRRYNVNIIFVDEHLKSFRYNGTLPDESLEQVLKIMSMVSPIRYTINGKTVVFSENKQRGK